MKRSLLLIFLFIYFFQGAFQGTLSAGQSPMKVEFPRWKSYTNSNYVKDLVLDKHFLWAASGGVIKYDLEKGTHIKYVKEHGLAGNNVLKLALHDHTLWIATASGITCHHIAKNTWKSFYKRDGLPDDAVTAVTVDAANNAIWFGTWEGYLFSFDTLKEKWNFLPAKISIPDTTITSLALDPATGLLLVGTWGKGLYSYHPGTQVLLKRSLSPGQTWDDQALDFISALFMENKMENKAKKLWLGTVNNGLWIMDLNTDLNTDLHADLSISSTALRKDRNLPDDWITSINVPPGQDRLFVTTRGSGLYIYSRRTGQWQTISLKTNPELPSNHLNSCAVSEGHIFLGSEGEGITRLDMKNGKLNRFMITNEVANNKVSVITPDNKNHRLWVGTEGNGAAQLDLLSGAWTILNTDNKVLSSDVVNCITVDGANGAAWIGTDLGMVRCEARSGKHRRYGLEEGLPSVMIYASAYDPANTLWAAFYYGSPAVFNPETEKWRPLENITGTVGYELYMNGDNNGIAPGMWLATTSGIIHYDLKYHQTTNYWPDIEFRSLLVDSQKGAIWAGSWEKGLFHLDIDSNRQSQVKEFENLSVLDIKKDLGQDTIWFATNEGVFSFEAGGCGEHDAREEPERFTFTHFDATGGLGMNYVLAVGITGDSTWFGTWGGGISRLLK